MPVLLEDTIAAISTPLGKGGLGVIRLSGKNSRSIALTLFSAGRQDLQDRVPVLGKLLEPESGDVIDQAVVTYFRSPRSFTREDVVEISCHGSPVVLKSALGLLLEAGARLATPGEFTLRAFLRGRIDLMQAEAIHDLIEAQTLFQAKVAHQQASGSLSRRLKPVKNALVQLISLLEAGIDFAEDDVSVPEPRQIEETLDRIETQLRQLRASFAFGKIVNSGLTIAIAGRPNVGKSSVFNALLQEARAIVTEIPGTTRDLVSETMQIEGIPVRLVDTAGIHQAEDQVERIGIDRAIETLADADRVLLVVDVSEPLRDEDLQILDHLQGRQYILVVNKIDLSERANLATTEDQAEGVCRVSAKTGEGIEALKRLIFEKYDRERLLDAESGLVTNLRHQRIIDESIVALENSHKSLILGMPHEVVLLDFYGGLKALNALTGETTVEDILGSIFSKFCIGK